jgi:4-hydroxymandelate oxidase
LRTVAANEAGFRELQLRARRLVDVSRVDTTVELFGWRLASPILLAPVGFQAVFHPEAEVATARAAAAGKHGMFVSSVSTFSVEEVASAANTEVGFQLYPTTNRDVTLGLLRRAERAGCRVVALTVDTPVVGNREGHDVSLAKMLAGDEVRMGNYEGLPEYASVIDPGLTWDFVVWLKQNTSMQVVLKGVVTREDAALAVQHGADGIVVSNHGGRQLESDRSTIACLPEVLEAVEGRFPVLLDGGIRRGTDVLKALALGARAVCIGRPYVWGLGAMGQEGVLLALELLQAELVRDMQLVGAPSLQAVNSSLVV